jgi:hypothetical protein
MAFPKIKDVTMLAVLDKATQTDPVEYCSDFMGKNPETGQHLLGLAVNMAQSFFNLEEDGDIIAHSTILSAVMFMTYEMVKAEVEAQEMEEHWG